MAYPHALVDAHRCGLASESFRWLIQAKGVAQQLVYLEVDAADADCLGGEPVYAGGRVVGVTTSGGYGHRVQQVQG